jgi:hypothetical protein
VVGSRHPSRNPFNFNNPVLARPRTGRTLAYFLVSRHGRACLPAVAKGFAPEFPALAFASLMVVAVMGTLSNERSSIMPTRRRPSARRPHPTLSATGGYSTLWACKSHLLTNSSTASSTATPEAGVSSFYRVKARKHRAVEHILSPLISPNEHHQGKGSLLLFASPVAMTPRCVYCRESRGS